MRETTTERRGTQVGFAIVLAVYGGLGAIMRAAARPLRQMYDETGVNLPAPTRWTTWAAEHPVLPIALLLGLIAPLAAAELFGRPARRWRTTIHVGLGLLGPVLLILGFWILLYLPFVRLHCPNH